MKRLLDHIGKFWCIHVHDSVMWPFRGRYQCRVCLREYPVRFEASAEGAMERCGNAFEEVAALGKA